MECRRGCAACCIQISISSPLPGLPEGKPPGLRCINLDENLLCRVWGTDDYPEVCRAFTPTLEMCGENREHAMAYLKELERLTGSVSG